MTDLFKHLPALLMARRNLARTKLRSSLAALGIIIGVVAIASLGVFGVSLQTAFLSGFGDIGNQIVVSPAYEEGVTSLDSRDVRRIQRAAAGAETMPIEQGRTLVEHGSEQTVVTLYGISRPSVAFSASTGRMPRELRDGALVGAAVAERMGLSAGNTITVNGGTYRVKAVLERQTGFSPVNPNRAIIVPPSAVEGDSYDQVVVQAESGQAANETAQSIRGTLNRRQKTVSILELSSVVDQITSFFDVLNAFLIGIGSVSLVVAGVSILNVMLMSTVERREEIGVMRAVGYHKQDVLKIMLGEAAILGVIGGLAGVVVSIGAGMAINSVTLDDPTAVFRLRSLSYVLVAFGFGVLTSLLSGLYPAWKAANENPVEALRS